MRERAALSLAFIVVFCLHASHAIAAPPRDIQAPVPKWQLGGCHYPDLEWCETGWYSSPAVADLDGDGNKEVIAGSYSVFALDGETGALEWRVAAGDDTSEDYRYNGLSTNASIVVSDVDDDGEIEIVTAHDGGYVSVYNRFGYFEPGWPQRPTHYGLSGLAVYDLDGDGQKEIIVTAGTLSPVNTWVFEPDGSLRAGWPQWGGGEGYAYGTFSDTLAVGDMNGDGQVEIIVPSDYDNIAAFKPDGGQVAANPIFNVPVWGFVNTFASLPTEIRGWSYCNPEDGWEELYLANFDNGAAVISDVNGDGVVETVVSSNIYDCSRDRRPTLYHQIYIFNNDRTRFYDGTYDWRTLPRDIGAPLSEDEDTIRNIRPSPVVVDLDGDGLKEILYPSFDGRLHAFWLDKTEHGQWPYSVYNPAEGVYRFPSEPAVVDLDNDGKAEVIFTSWPEARDNLVGKLHILNYLGEPLYELPLPPSWSTEYPDAWNGGLAAPTLADIDNDFELEILVNTATAGVMAFDLPGTTNARILWGTGRENYQRTASPLRGSLEDSSVQARPSSVSSGDIITYTIQVENPYPTIPSARFTNTLPADVTLVGSPWASSGDIAAEGLSGQGQPASFVWTGAAESMVPIVITFSVQVDPELAQPRKLIDELVLDDEEGNSWHREAVVLANATSTHLPFVIK